MSNASDDLPDPDTPVTTVIARRGISTSIALRLCSLAPRTESIVTAGILPRGPATAERVGARPGARGCRAAAPVLFFGRTPHRPLKDPMYPRTILRSAALVVLVLAAGLGAALVGQAPQSTAAADIVARVKGQFAPDARIAVFDVKAEVKDNAVELVGDVEQPAAKEALLKAFRDAGLANVVDRIAVLPDPAMAAKPLGIVTVSVAVMKTRPSHASELGNQLIMGMVVKLLKTESRLVLRAVARRPVSRMDGAQPPGADDEGPGGRRGPRAEGDRHVPVRVRPRAAGAGRGARLRPRGRRRAEHDRPQRAAGWRCSCPTGARGSSRTRTPPTTRPGRRAAGSRRRPIEQTARRFMGVPYLWGGTSAKGFDCSGYLKTVFRLNGLELQRDTDQQANEGVAVPTDNDLAEVRKGDVLFFGPRAGVTRITHTGIYLGGKLFIHCAGMVKLNSLDSGVAHLQREPAEAPREGPPLRHAVGTGAHSQISRTRAARSTPL